MEKNDYKKIVASCFCSMMLVSSVWAQESDFVCRGYWVKVRSLFD